MARHIPFQFRDQIKPIATSATLLQNPIERSKVANVAGPTRLDAASVEERLGILLHEGRIPRHYALTFAEMQHECPNEVPKNRWEQFINDTGIFLDRWGDKAHAFGWRVRDLFGLDTKSPLARFDRMGLCWLLKGQTVVAIAANAARLSGGLTYYRSDDAFGVDNQRPAI